MGRRRRRGAAAAALLAVAGCGGDPASPPATPSRFTDAYAASGIRIDAAPVSSSEPVNAAAIADCDADGLPDAFITNWPNRASLWRNLGGFRFGPAETPPGLDGLTPTASAFGDLDNDGLPDLLVAIGMDDRPLLQELRAYRNRGACRFEDVSAAWGFGPWPSSAESMIAGVDLADVNLDGRLDVLGRRLLDPGAAMRLYLSRPDGTWVESMSEVFGVIPGSNWANLFTDVDDDGLADLFILFDEHMGPPARFLRRAPPGSARLYVQEDFVPGLFSTRTPPAALMGAAAGDVDGDGRLDLYFLDIGPQHLFTHRSGRRDVAAEAGVDIPTLPGKDAESVAFGVSLADYDNDTWPDLAVTCGIIERWATLPSAFLRHNRGDGTFEDAASLLPEPTRFASMWMTASDLDRDGRVDYWMGGSGGPPRLLRNGVAGGRSIAVRLRGRTSNAEGVGARVTARVGARSLVQEMQSGGSPWGYGEHRLVFGLGRAGRADSLEVRWPDGYVQRTGSIAAGTEAVVEEPDLVRVEPAVAAAGGEVRVVVRPARPSGEPLGPGHQVAVTVDPGGAALAVSDDGAGAYSATARGLAAGLHGFTIRIDGVALLARPQALVR